MNSTFSYIAVEGAIGVGKTTLTQLLQPILQAEMVLEAFEDNPFLARYYEDPTRWAFQVQTFFLLNRHQQQQKIPDILTRQNIVSDYTFDKNRIFAELILTDEELKLYTDLQEALARRIPQPDLVVYLRASVETLMKRISLRARRYESTMQLEYIAKLGKMYDTFYESYQFTPLLVIDTDELDVHKSQDLQEVAEQIIATLGSLRPREG